MTVRPFVHARKLDLRGLSFGLGVIRQPFFSGRQLAERQAGCRNKAILDSLGQVAQVSPVLTDNNAQETIMEKGNPMKIDIETGALRLDVRADGAGEAILHATGKELKSVVKAYPGLPKNGREPFKTINLEVDGSRVTIFLTDEQLAAVRLSLQEGEALQPEETST